MPSNIRQPDPYRVLDVDPRASGATIKSRWRELAREHHPDRAAGDRAEQVRLTNRMARINAAYDLLRDPARRARYDQSASSRQAAWDGDEADRWWGPFGSPSAGGPPAGPPPPPPTRPVTARFDMSSAYRPPNSTLSEAPRRFVGHPPLGRSRGVGRPGPANDLRASTPTGPVERRRSRSREPQPTLREARETALDFGKFRGYTLGEVELLEPAYVDWIAQTITRDRELVSKARQIQAELERKGIDRARRSPAPGFGGAGRTG